MRGVRRALADALLRRRSRAGRPSCASPRPLAPAQRPRGLDPGPRRRRSETRRSRRRGGHRDRRRPPLPRSRTATATAPMQPARRSRARRDGTVLVEVLGSQPRPFRRARLRILSVKVGDETGHVSATWFNQPWVADKLDARAPPCSWSGSRDKRGFRVSGYEIVSGRGSARGTAARGRLAPLGIRHPRPALVPGPSRDREAEGRSGSGTGLGRRAVGAERDRGLAGGAAGPPRAGRRSAMRSGPRTSPRSMEDLSRRESGSPSKSCSSTRRCWRPASAPTARRGRRRASASRASWSTAGSSSLAVRADRGPAGGLRRDRGRPRLRRADAAAVDGRGGLGQDRGRRLLDAAGARSRLPGGADGADRDAGRAARDHPRPAAGARRRSRSRC